MAFPIEAWQAALTGARQGMSVNEVGRILRNAGVGIRRETLLELYRNAVSVVHHAGEEPFRPLASKPQGGEIATYPTEHRTGYGQHVQLVYRERGTGKIVRLNHTTFGQNLVTRETAIRNAVQAYAGNEEEYDQELIGATYTTTYRYTPIGVA